MAESVQVMAESVQNTTTRLRRIVPRNAIIAIKESVDIADYAGTLTDLKPAGLRLVGCCPMHLEKTASFTIYPESQSWYCFGACSMGGDVLDLHRAVEGGSVRDAILRLSELYAVQLPTDLDEWDRRQAQKDRLRAKAEKVRVNVLCRRLFRALILQDECIQGIEDPDDRRSEIRAAWTEFQTEMRGIRR
ncbi:MAG: CHC2 zinc finger domain-containing protein [Actinomycetota bacterium]|nr:CHC2 zinc finger domain-containing protein [Actinomycetota bacterium]